MVHATRNIGVGLASGQLDVSLLPFVWWCSSLPWQIDFLHATWPRWFKYFVVPGPWLKEDLSSVIRGRGGTLPPAPTHINHSEKSD